LLPGMAITISAPPSRPKDDFSAIRTKRTYEIHAGLEGDCDAFGEVAADKFVTPERDVPRTQAAHDAGRSAPMGTTLKGSL
jgi:hypothetical protein